jgi:hypothetical protein
MSSDVFIISSTCEPDPAIAIQQVVELAGVKPSRIQDAVYGPELASTPAQLEPISRAAGLNCPSVAVSSSLRALSFSASSILSDDATMTVVVGSEGDGCVAMLLASPEAVGVLNLIPRGRLAAHSVTGPESALRLAGLSIADIQLVKEGDSLLLVHEVLGELEALSARWALLSSPDVSVLIERV